MIKYRVTNQNGHVEFLSQSEAQDFALLNGGEISEIQIDSYSSIAEEVERKLHKFDIETQQYIYSKYPAPSQQSYVLEMVFAIYNNQTNKMAKIASIRSWARTVLDYHFLKWAEIEACETKEQLDAITWDFSPFDATDPGVSLREVLIMND